MAARSSSFSKDGIDFSIFLVKAFGIGAGQARGQSGVDYHVGHDGGGFRTGQNSIERAAHAGVEIAPAFAAGGRLAEPVLDLAAGRIGPALLDLPPGESFPLA